MAALASALQELDEKGYFRFAEGGIGIVDKVVTSFTEYWPVVLGVVLLALIYVFPGGVMRLFGGARPADSR